MKRNVLIVGGVIVVLLIVAGVFGWQRVMANAASSNARSGAQTATVTRGSLTATVNAAGNVFAPYTAAFSFSSSGRVATVAVQVGDRVKKGQLLMQLDSTDLQLALKTVQTNLANAESAYDATQGKSQLAVRLAESNVTSAQATLDTARAKNVMITTQLPGVRISE
ncbi:MAG: biotin/lipoyl-binding protein [Chloroflexi bacterium]|nr:biotin/lipoyl-binding protein [Chloroflexota bacterium]